MKFSLATFFSTVLASLFIAQQVGAAGIVCDHICLPGETGCCVPPPTTTAIPTLEKRQETTSTPGLECFHFCLPGETGCCIPPPTTTPTPALKERAEDICQIICPVGVTTGCCVPAQTPA
ncbi:hypothetical protein ACEPAH_6138 [Sanghuangporus vaninii]